MEMVSLIRTNCYLLSTSLVRIGVFACLNSILDAFVKGLQLSPSTIDDFMTSISSQPHSRHINFGEFRDFFLLLPRKLSPTEIYRYYEMRKYMGDDGRGAARVNMEGKANYVLRVNSTRHNSPSTSRRRQSQRRG